MKSVDEYIAGFPPDVQKIRRKMRTTIRKAAPDAEETISYQIPAFKQNGALVYFAAHRAHIGMYPITRTVNEQFSKELSPYAAGKSTARFPLDEPIPYALIKRIVTLRVKQNRAKPAAKKVKAK